jgi:hypothetical protein
MMTTMSGCSDEMSARERDGGWGGREGVDGGVEVSKEEEPGRGGEGERVVGCVDDGFPVSEGGIDSERVVLG